MPERIFTLSVKGLIHDSRGRILLLKRSPVSHANPGKWDLPGGKLDPGEAPDQTLKREAMEETGLKIAVEKLAGAAETRLDDRSILYIILEAQAVEGEVRLSSEHQDFVWAARDTLGDMDLVPVLREVLQKVSPKR